MRKFALVAAALAALPLAACQSDRCGSAPESEPAVVQVYDDAPVAPAACAQVTDPCAGGCCVAPQVHAPAVVQAPAVVGEYGYVLGPPGVRENVVSVLQTPVGWGECLATGAYKAVGVGLETINCLLGRLVPGQPAPSQRLVRIERVPRPDVRVVRPRAQGCVPVPPAPPPPSDPNEPPPSIPAVRAK